MADRTMARVFRSIFSRLAEDPTNQHREWAKKFWEESQNYDFRTTNWSATKHSRRWVWLAKG